MKVKRKWCNTDFEAMGWHDSRLYTVELPNEDAVLLLDIDYIFKWEKSFDSVTGFWVSPCDLSFENVSNLRINFSFADSNLLFISDIMRTHERLTPNGKFKKWNFEIECDKGIITFSATGFTQIVRREPIFSESQDIVGKRFE